MDSALIDFLKKDYPAHFGQEWKEDTMQVRREQRPKGKFEIRDGQLQICLLYTSPSPRDVEESRMPSSA